MRCFSGFQEERGMGFLDILDTLTFNSILLFFLALTGRPVELNLKDIKKESGLDPIDLNHY
jgi:hypothetical protein